MNKFVGFALIQCLFWIIPGFSQQELSSSATTPDETTTPQLIPANQISERALNIAALLRNVTAREDLKEELDTLKEELSIRKKQIDELQKETLRRLKMEGPVSIIEEDTKEWIRMQERIEGWITTLSAKADILDSVLDKLSVERENWALTRGSASAGDLPEALRKQVRNTLDSIIKVKGQVQSSRDEILNLKVSIGYTLARVDEIVEVQEREIVRRRKGILRIDSPPLWSIFDQTDSQGKISEQLRETWDVNYRWIGRYVTEQLKKLMKYVLLLVLLSITLVFDLLVRVAKDHPEVAEDPQPDALFRDFGNSSLDFQLRAWTRANSWIHLNSELRVAVASALTKAGIEILFPQRDLHLRSIDEGVSLPVVRKR